MKLLVVEKLFVLVEKIITYIEAYRVAQRDKKRQEEHEQLDKDPNGWWVSKYNRGMRPSKPPSKRKPPSRTKP